MLVTGGSSGIGAALVRAFAAEGDQVFFTFRGGQARAEALIKEVEEEAGGRSPPPRAFHLDQGDWASVQALVAALPSTPDVLVNNAALGSATVAAVASEPHLQDQALLQVCCCGCVCLCVRARVTRRACAERERD